MKKILKSRWNIFLFAAFLTGISAGAFSVNTLDATQGEEISRWFGLFDTVVVNNTYDSWSVFISSIISNTRLMMLIWFMGAVVIGMPLVFIIIGAKGFTTGFCSGLLIKTLAIKGVWTSLACVLPSLLILTPFLILSGTHSIEYSLILTCKKNKPIPVTHYNRKFTVGFLQYTSGSLLLMLSVIPAAFSDSFIVPFLYRLIT